MSAVEQAIRDAFEHGWGQNKSPYEHKFVGANMYWSRWLDANGSEYTLPVAQHWIDPAFWQALGRGRGWGTKKIDGKEWKTGRDGYINVWQSYWHDFIDHLAEGKDAESFFASL